MIIMSLVYHFFLIMPTLALNKHGLHDYSILDTFEAGIVLSGAETKSARGGHINLKGSFVTLKNNEVWLLNMHISPYAFSSKRIGYDPIRSRKLLLKRKEIAYLTGKLQEKGLTALPLKIYTLKQMIKVEIGIGRGKQQYEKRELLKKRAIEREMRSATMRNKR